MLLFRLRYYRILEARQDLDQQLRYGGLVVRALPNRPDRPEQPDQRLQKGEAVQLALVLPSGATVQAPAQVLQVIGGAVALCFPQGSAALVQQLEERLKGERPGKDPQDLSSDRGAVHEVTELVAPDEVKALAQVPVKSLVPAPEPVAPEPAAPSARSPASAAEVSSAQKVQLALHGDADQRAAILRDKNRMLHPHVLRNPAITQEEVIGIAKNPQTLPDMLDMIAGRKEWVGQRAIAMALVRNPRTPQGAGARALDHLPVSDQRMLAKAEGSAPPHIVAAARKKTLR